MRADVMGARRQSTGTTRTREHSYVRTSKVARYDGGISGSCPTDISLRHTENSNHGLVQKHLSTNTSTTLTMDQTTSGESEPIAQALPGTNERFLLQFLRLIILFITSPQRLILHRKRFVASFISSVALIAIAATSTTALAKAPYVKA